MAINLSTDLDFWRRLRQVIEDEREAVKEDVIKLPINFTDYVRRQGYVQALDFVINEAQAIVSPPAQPAEEEDD